MKTILIAILAVFVIIAGAFYWYSYRPSKIRTYCSEVLFTAYGTPASYERCLYVHGINK